MQLTNEFDVPRPLDEAWAVLTDVERIAPCMPGAQLTEVEGDVYHGNVKVKVGPVVAQYAGQARFVEKDAEAHRAVLEAKGKERTGRGLANALVTAQLLGQGDATHVVVTTDLTISGPLAQFGRGAIAEVSTKLLNQFVQRLRETVLETGAVPSGAAPEVVTPEAVTPEAVTPEAVPPEAAPPTPTPSEARPEQPQVPPPVSANGTRPATSAAPSVPATPQEGAPPQEPTPEEPTRQEPAPQPTRRIIESAPAEPADLLSVARGSILKRLIPLVIVIAAIIVVIILLV